jgi:hypothetical protein
LLCLAVDSEEEFQGRLQLALFEDVKTSLQTQTVCLDITSMYACLLRVVQAEVLRDIRRLRV